MKKLLFITLFFTCLLATAQKESNYWYFGGYCGLSFTSGVPVNIPGGLSTAEGSASASDPITGNLLMYTNGMALFNSSHLLMPNGGGLYGNTSSTQAAIIVPQPGSSTIFYVFTTDALEIHAHGYCYSIVDMSLAGGLGDVIAGSKNITLIDTCSEQLSAVKHANCIDWWIMMKGLNNNKYYAYLLTSAGLSPPVISNVGFPTGVSSFGQAKFSPDGTKYAITTSSLTQLFDFDNATGVLSNAMTVTGGTGPGYGVAFSGNNSRLYICRGTAASQIWQYDLSSGDPATIVASGTGIGSTGGYNALQLARDHKIYVSHDGFNNLSVINNPNALGAACNYVPSSIPLTNTSQKGLPSFPDSYFNEISPCVTGLSASISVTPVSCNGSNNAMAWVNVVNNNGPYTISWSPGGSTNDTIGPLGPGTYTVVVTDSAGTTDTNAVIITEPDTLEAGLYTDVDSVCAGTPVHFYSGTVTGGAPSYHYQWSTGNITANMTHTPSASGYVSLTITDNNGCIYADSVYIHVFPDFTLTAFGDTCICSGQSTTIGASGSPGYWWSSGDTTSTLTVSPSIGTWYSVSYFNGGCSHSDSVFICVNPTPVIDLSGDDTVCTGYAVNIHADVSGGTTPYTYAWSVPGSSADVSFVPTGSITVDLVITDSVGCTDSADFGVNVFPVPNLHTSADTCVCTGENITVQATGAPFYEWNNGATTSSVSFTATNDTLLTVICHLGPCTASDSVFICVHPLPVLQAWGDTTVEYKHPVELHAAGDGPFSWSPTGGLSCWDCSTPTAEPASTTVYIVSNTNGYGCVNSDTVVVEIFYLVRIPNIITPNGDGINDKFFITGLPDGSAIRIFNRWGNEAFFTSDYRNDWSIEVDGVYYYVLVTPDGKDFSGFIQVSGNR